MLALLTYSSADPGWSFIGSASQVSNGAGRAGAWLADVLFSMIGYSAYLVPVMLAYRGVVLFKARYNSVAIPGWLILIRLFGFIFVVIGLTGMCHIATIESQSVLPMGNGGAILTAGLSLTRSTSSATACFRINLLLLANFFS